MRLKIALCLQCVAQYLQSVSRDRFALDYNRMGAICSWRFLCFTPVFYTFYLVMDVAVCMHPSTPHLHVQGTSLTAGLCCQTRSSVLLWCVFVLTMMISC